MSRWMKTMLAGAASAIIATTVGVGLGVGPASAGGWAMSSLDPMATPVAGKSLDVGFTIRQHGVTPVNPDGEVGVNVRASSGSDQFFAATPVGAGGHYVARVRIAESGSYTWQIRQGWFPRQDLGRIDVAESAVTGAGAGSRSASGTGGSAYRWPLSVRLLLPALGVALGAFAVADAIGARRRRTRALTTGHPVEA